MAQVASAAAQQKDNLCGPFCASRILGVDQDLVALRAGTRLPAATDEPSVPAGAESRIDYTYDLPTTSAAESGTSVAGLMRAIDALAEGRLQCTPVSGAWTAERVERLVEGAGARLIANIRTGRLWGSRPSAEQILAELHGRPVEGPPAEWDVGHFVELKAIVRVMGGALVLVHDTYPSLGLDGFHLQPPRAVAAALLRGDGRQGGIIAVAPPEQSQGIEALARDIGLEVAAWDNGSRS